MTRDIRDVLREAAPKHVSAGSFEDIWHRSTRLRVRRRASIAALCVGTLALGALLVGGLTNREMATPKNGPVPPAGGASGESARTPTDSPPPPEETDLVLGGTWEKIPRAPIEGRQGNIAAWTGRELVLWGGLGNSWKREYVDGAALDAATNRWRPLSMSPLETSDAREAAWTGDEVIVWGGEYGDGSHQHPDNGAAYDPAQDSWRPLPRAPQWSLASHTLVWTGSEMIAWGGVGMPRAGVAYDPATDEWRETAQAPIETRHQHTAVWTGTEMIVWGGLPPHPPGGEFEDGAAYDPAADSWRTIAPAPIAGRSGASAVWTGTEMMVWGGWGPLESLADGAAYNPATDTWRTLATAPVRDFVNISEAWTGTEMIVSVDGVFAAYDPERDTWSMLPTPPGPPRVSPSMVWTGRAVIVWGGWGSLGGELLDDGAMFVPD
jgi:N-acetylneuraminic acid mutarotase